MDILVANRDEQPFLLRNVIHDRGNWIKFLVLDEYGKSAEGVMVEARVGERTIFRGVRTTFSYLSCSDPRVHFGLGDAMRVDDVTVHWIDGTTENFGPFDAGQIVTLRPSGSK
jgi:hypothetical protein